jgi:membrane protease YdiL (CAAX protease family)
MSRKYWFYLLGPVIILNTIPVCLFGAVFALAYQRGTDHQNLDLSQPLFWLYFAVFMINWLLAIFVLQKYRREGKSIRSLIAGDGEIFKFSWKPVLVLFVVFNGIWVIYILAYEWLAGGWPSYTGFQDWQKAVFIVLFPISAGFTEELYWRGFLITELEAAGQTSKRAIFYSAAGFSLVHGVFFLDKLLVTFLLGLVAGIYYTRERKLLPLMFTHAFADIWSYGISLFAG